MGMAPEATADDSTGHELPTGDACECYMARGLDGDLSECGATFESGAAEYLCSRPDGHDGPHAACGTAMHPIVTWGGEGDR